MILLPLWVFRSNRRKKDSCSGSDSGVYPTAPRTRDRSRSLLSMMEEEWYFSRPQSATMIFNDRKGKRWSNSWSNSMESQLWVQCQIYIPLKYPNISSCLCIYTYRKKNLLCSSKHEIKSCVKHVLSDRDYSLSLDCVCSCFTGCALKFVQKSKKNLQNRLWTN